MDVEALHKIGYGLYVVCSRDGNRRSGQIANTVFQVTSEPPQIAVAINKKNLTHELIQKSGAFGVSILSRETPMSFIGKFGFKSSREVDKFASVDMREGELGMPLVLDYALAYIEAKVTGSADVGTHTIFIGKVADATVLREGEPMTYAYYHLVKGGKEPETAPVYRKEEPAEKSGAGAKTAPAGSGRYECLVCGYVYDPKKGDPQGGIAPGTPFDELPDSWVCPVCGADKSQFKQIYKS